MGSFSPESLARETSNYGKRPTTQRHTLYLRYLIIFSWLDQLIFLCLASFVAAELLEVVSLPGIGALSTKTIAGRVVTNEKFNTELFLLAFESQNNPESDPTVLWLREQLF